MAQERMNNADFLMQLTSLLKKQSTTSKGTLFFTQKRLTSSSESNSSDSTSQNQYPVLLRVTNGTSTRNQRSGKIKLATVVEASNVDEFFGKYAEVCRSGMDGLKKRDRSKQKKRSKKAKQAASSAAKD